MEMLVWQLRRTGDGAKLPKDALDGPHRGWLRLERANIAGERTLHAGLYGAASRGAPTLIQGLTHVEVRKMDERGLLLLGIQSVPGSGPASPRWRQAWFCKPVIAPSPPVPGPS